MKLIGMDIETKVTPDLTKTKLIKTLHEFVKNNPDIPSFSIVFTTNKEEEVKKPAAKEKSLSELIEEKYPIIFKKYRDTYDTYSAHSTVIDYLLDHGFYLEAHNIIAMDIAKILDAEYDDHIRNCDTVYVINNLNGKPHLIHKKDLDELDWENLVNNKAMFRSELDLIIFQKIAIKVNKLVWQKKLTRK